MHSGWDNKEKSSISEDRAQGSTEENAVASSESQTRALLSIPCILFFIEPRAFHPLGINCPSTYEPFFFYPWVLSVIKEFSPFLYASHFIVNPNMQLYLTGQGCAAANKTLAVLQAQVDLAVVLTPDWSLYCPSLYSWISFLSICEIKSF